MALQIPQQPQDAGVTLPLAPGNPPSLTDLSNAFNFKKEVQIHTLLGSNHVQASSTDDVGCAMVYEHTLTHIVSATAHGPIHRPAMAPPWFGPVQRQLNRIEANSVRATNATNGTGSIYPFLVVPFNDGTDPTGDPHNLPRLGSVADVNALSSADANRYLIGYGVRPIPAGVAGRRRLVKVSIGCRAA